MEQNTVALVMFELQRGVPAKDTVSITALMQYNGGLLVTYSHSYQSMRDAKSAPHTVTEHRTAFFQIISITTDNDNVQKKWDFIC